MTKTKKLQSNVKGKLTKISACKMTEEALQQSEERYKKLFEGSIDPVILADAKTGIILDCNQSAAKLVGRNKSELIGQPQRILHPPEEVIKGFSRSFSVHRKKKKALLLESRVITKTGERKEVSIKASLLEIHGKKVVYGIFHDITARKKAFGELEHRYAFEKVIAEVAKYFAGVMPLEFDVHLNKILVLIGQFMLVDRCYIYLFHNNIMDRIHEWRAKGIHSFFEKPKEIKIKEWGWFNQEIAKNEVVFVNDVEKLSVKAKKEKKYIKSHGVQSLLMVPIWEYGKIKGFLGVDSVKKQKEWRASDAELLRITSEMLTQSLTRKRAVLGQLENARSLKETLLGVVESMGVAVERRDPYTAGHQKRVSELATLIARELKLPEEQIEGIRLGSLIHDIGKNSIPAEILNRSGELTHEEFGLVKIHPREGYEILKNLKFPWPIAKMTLQHHERLDGSGYPDGLKGNEIILEARILAVADVVEAICSYRPYRPALAIKNAIKEITKDKGAKYDAKVVSAFLRLIKKGKCRFLVKG